ncbi:MAG: hypothetical protein K8U57_01275 [Planctomycetes bacterium]|nr:hypothetical protein [Planctomycetota bacterium]
MLNITPEVEAILQFAAKLRAEGSSWNAVARAVDYDADDLEQLCKDAGKVYQLLYSKARRAVVRESLAESMFTLRRLLREGNARESRHAAECLARISMTFVRHRQRSKANEPKPDPRLEGLREEDIELVKWLSTKTDEEIAEFAQRRTQPPTLPEAEK